MSREIRFRAWDKRSNKMVDIQSIHWGGAMGNFTKTAIKTMDYHLGACAEGDTLVADKYELMQFTGSKDIRGQDIYRVMWSNQSYRMPIYTLSSGMTSDADSIFDPLMD